MDANIRDGLFFLLGFISCAFMALSFFGTGAEVPFGQGARLTNVSAPSNSVPEEAIRVFEDKIVLEIPGASLSEYAPTGSMRPVFDEGANGIRIVPRSPADISVGDIVSFEYGDILVVHRVVEKGEDANGIYFITKGDNNAVSDGKVRFDQIKYITVGVIW